MELRSNAQSKTWFCVLLSLDSMSMKISKKCVQDFHKMCPKFVSFHSKAWKAKTTEWGGKLQCPSFCDKAVWNDGLRLHWEWPSECGLICGDSSGKQISLGNFSISLQFVEILLIITARAFPDILLINAPCFKKSCKSGTYLGIEKVVVKSSRLERVKVAMVIEVASVINWSEASGRVAASLFIKFTLLRPLIL